MIWITLGSFMLFVAIYEIRQIPKSDRGLPKYKVPVYGWTTFGVVGFGAAIVGAVSAFTQKGG